MGKSQAQIAEMAGISQRMYSAIETGERRPSPEVAEKLAEIFGLSIEEMWRLFYRAKEA